MKEILKSFKKFYPFLITVSILSGMGLIVWFGIVPFQGFVIEKADSIQEYYATRENRANQMNKLPDLQSQFENIQAEEDILKILLSEERVVDFVQTLERLAKETNVHVLIQSKTGTIIEEKSKPKVAAKKGSTPDPVESEGVEKKGKTPVTILESVPFDRYLHVEVVVKGEYQSIVTFLHKMETLPLALDVIGMGVRMRNEEDLADGVLESASQNPFLLLSQGGTAGVGQEENVPVVTPGALEASFDTLVYLDK